MTDYFVHPTSVVDDGAEIGANTKIWHFCHICGPSQVGPECNIGQNVFVAKNTRIGRNVKIQNNVSVYEGVQIEDDVFCGPSMVFTNVVNPRAFVSRKSEYRKTLVRRGATIGANATIICGVTIGRYALVGAMWRTSPSATAARRGRAGGRAGAGRNWRLRMSAPNARAAASGTSWSRAG